MTTPRTSFTQTTDHGSRFGEASRQDALDCETDDLQARADDLQARLNRAAELAVMASEKAAADARCPQCGALLIADYDPACGKWWVCANDGLLNGFCQYQRKADDAVDVQRPAPVDVQRPAPLAPVPQFFDDGSAFYPSASRPGVFHCLTSALFGGRATVTGCDCEAGRRGLTCWHKRDFQARLDRANSTARERMAA